MKSNLKKATLLLTGVMVGSKLFAQTPDSTNAQTNYVQPFSGGDRAWSIGLHGGLLTPYNIFSNQRTSDFRSPHEQVGYGGYVKYQVLPAFGLRADFLRGKVEGARALPADNTGPQSFKTDLNWSTAISAEFTFANINWRHKHGFIQPYVSVGGGVLAYKPTVVNNDGSSTTFGGGGDIHNFFIPVGAGFKLNLGPVVNLDLGYTVNFVNADNFDAYNHSTTSDRFSYAHIGLEFILGKSTKPARASYNPVNSMRTEYMWQNQQLQSQFDAQKAENAKLRSDLDATNANIAKLTTDTDGDGVYDTNDKCPGTPIGTKVDGQGCPLAKPEVKVYVTEEDKKIVKDAIRNLEFDLGKATIRSTSFPSLDRVANLLTEKNFSLKLAGHTDNTGSDQLNLKLSKDRAESIKAYLVEKGANASRIEATGYGESQPIATNKTAAGRQQNRRVEFTLY